MLKNVFEYVEKNSSDQLMLFISGCGGVGKSYLLRTLVLFFETGANFVEVLVTSGNVAKLVNGQTIHRMFKILPDMKNHFSFKDLTWSDIAATNIFIIDEVSMLSGELLETRDRICCEVASGDNKKHLFGGKSLIMFGDLYQLPPVTKAPIYR